MDVLPLAGPDEHGGVQTRGEHVRGARGCFQTKRALIQRRTGVRVRALKRTRIKRC